MIAQMNQDTTLNKRDEVMTRCKQAHQPQLDEQHLVEIVRKGKSWSETVDLSE